MASEAITRNDLTAILNEVLPPTPSEYKKLLWTNPSPSSAFAAQTISLDLSDYDDVEIEVVGSATNANTTTQTFKMKANVGGLLSVSANNIWWRYVTPTSTGVEFGGGYITSTYGASATANNNYIVPRKIYGIKYERVQPPTIDVLEWKLQGTATNSNTVSMPSDYHEILLWGSYSTIQFSAVVPKQEISSTAIYPRSASYYNSTNNECVAFKVTSTEAKIEGWWYNGGNGRTSGLTFKLYYR